MSVTARKCDTDSIIEHFFVLTLLAESDCSAFDQNFLIFSSLRNSLSIVFISYHFVSSHSQPKDLTAVAPTNRKKKNKRVVVKCALSYVCLFVCVCVL